MKFFFLLSMLYTFQAFGFSSGGKGKSLADSYYDRMGDLFDKRQKEFSDKMEAIQKKSENSRRYLDWLVFLKQYMHECRLKIISGIMDCETSINAKKYTIYPENIKSLLEVHTSIITKIGVNDITILSMPTAYIISTVYIDKTIHSLGLFGNIVIQIGDESYYINIKRSDSIFDINQKMQTENITSNIIYDDKQNPALTIESFIFVPIFLAESSLNILEALGISDGQKSIDGVCFITKDSAKISEIVGGSAKINNRVVNMQSNIIKFDNMYIVVKSYVEKFTIEIAYDNPSIIKNIENLAIVYNDIMTKLEKPEQLDVSTDTIETIHKMFMVNKNLNFQHGLNKIYNDNYVQDKKLVERSYIDSDRNILNENILHSNLRQIMCNFVKYYGDEYILSDNNIGSFEGLFLLNVSNKIILKIFGDSSDALFDLNEYGRIRITNGAFVNQSVIDIDIVDGDSLLSIKDKINDLNTAFQACIKYNDNENSGVVLEISYISDTVNNIFIDMDSSNKNIAKMFGLIDKNININSGKVVIKNTDNIIMINDCRSGKYCTTKTGFKNKNIALNKQALLGFYFIETQSNVSINILKNDTLSSIVSKISSTLEPDYVFCTIENINKLFYIKFVCYRDVFRIIEESISFANFIGIEHSSGNVNFTDTRYDIELMGDRFMIKKGKNTVIVSWFGGLGQIQKQIKCKSGFMSEIVENINKSILSNSFDQEIKKMDKIFSESIKQMDNLEQERVRQEEKYASNAGNIMTNLSIAEMMRGM